MTQMRLIKDNSRKAKESNARSFLRFIGPIGVIGVMSFAMLAPTTSFAKPPKLQQDVEWMWQYSPDQNNPGGRENELAQDARFKPFLEQNLTAPQHFWGQPIAGRWRSLANTALDHLTVPDKVLADDNRYLAVSGCTLHFCPDRGLLWVDLNGAHHLVVFCAIDWTKQGAPTTDPQAEYTLYLYSNDPLLPDTVRSASAAHATASNTDLRLPPALTKAIGRWAAEPLAGSKIVQRVTHAVVVDPDGTEHEVQPSSIGVAPVMHTITNGNTPSPDTDTPADDSTPVLKPRR